MDRQQIAQLQEMASEHYLRGEFRDALEAWQRLLAIDPGDEQAMEGVRLSSMLAEGSDPARDAEPPAGASPVDPAELRRRLDEVDAHLEAGDLKGAVELSDRLATEMPSDPAVLDARDRAHHALETEMRLREQLARAKADLAAGRPEAATTSCKAVLAVDPHHFEARALLRQCEETLTEGDPLDVDLRVLDALSSHLDGARQAGTRTPPEAPTPASVNADEPAAPVAVGTEERAAPPETPAPSDSAAEELRRRVNDLLEEAEREATAGRVDDALGILSRVFILDEQNEKAQALEQQFRAAQGRSNLDLDNWLQEAVQDFGAGRIEEARELFQKVLGRHPGHLEALDYLEKIDNAQAMEEREAAAAASAPRFHGEDLLTSGLPLDSGGTGVPAGPRTLAAEPTASAIPLEPAAAGRPKAAPEAAGNRPWNLSSAGVEGRSPAMPNLSVARRSLLPLPLLAGLVVLAIAGLAGAVVWKLPGLLHSESGGLAPSAKAAGPEAPARAAAPAVAPDAPREAAPAPTNGSVAAAKTVPDAMARAKAAMDSGAYAEAVIAYNEALKLDPSLDEARAGLTRAGEHYKIQKAERDQIDRAKAAFAEGEYTPALKILYRLPEGKYAGEIERYKVNAWYNLGLISLRAGNCKQAQESFDEALTIRSGETDVRRAKSLAQRYQATEKDRAFYDTVEAIPFRRIDE
jgi:tetratricopeptide (TPR) repeat protein